ncbi:MAG: YncE family protein [Thermoplasmata archaeon]|nr:YncE family protein [Thermoplasmata archaeon]
MEAEPRRATVRTSRSGRLALATSVSLLVLLVAAPAPALGAFHSLAVSLAPDGSAGDPNHPAPAPVALRLATPTGSVARPLTGPNPPVGTVLATIGVPSSPQGVVYDPANQYVYVANSVAGKITIFNGTSVVVILVVSGYPIGGAFDPVNGIVYFALYSSNAVVLINGTTIATTLTVGTSPYAAAFNPMNSEIYVTNYGSNNVTRILGSTVQAGSIAVGSEPTAAAYDPSTHQIFVTDYGAKAVTVISGSSVVATIGVGSGPEGLAYGGASGTMYVANSVSGNISVILSGRVVATVPLPGLPYGLAFDPGNGYLYAAENNLGALEVVNGTGVVGSILVGSSPFAIAVDPWNGCLYVTDTSGSAVSIITTGLLLGTPAVTPIGNPQNSSDVGQPILFNASVFANSSWTFSSSANVTPTTGLGCSTFPTLTLSGGYGYLRLACIPLSPESYTVVLNLSAVGRLSSLVAIGFEVFPKPTAPIPIASHNGTKGITSTDVTLPVQFTESPVGGTGTFTAWRWTGFPAFVCSGTLGPQASCQFTRTGGMTLVVAFNDSNGLHATSPPLTFTVDTLPTVAPPTADRRDVDVGQPIAFSTGAAGGSGGYSYHWHGLPTTCAIASTPTFTCIPTTATTLNASVNVVDSDGGSSAIAGIASVVVRSDPVVSTPIATPSTLTEGETFTVTVSVSGGPGNQTVLWEGLPGGCTESGLTAVCATKTFGIYDVVAKVTDGNGFTVLSNRAHVVVNQGNGGGPGGTNGSDLLFGIAAGAFYAVLAVVLIIVALIAGLAAYGLRQSRASGGGDEEGEPEPLGDSDLYEDVPNGEPEADASPADEDLPPSGDEPYADQGPEP